MCLAAARRRRAWRQAAEYLNSRGLAACVPPEMLPRLQASGLAVWANTDRAAA